METKPEALSAVSAQSVLDGKVPGYPQHLSPGKLASLECTNWSLPDEDLCLPVLTLSETAFAHNLKVMAQYAAEQDVFLCPHGKTMMSPQLLTEVLGCQSTIGLSAATVAQARVMAETGSPVVLLANEVVGRGNIRGLAHLIGEFPNIRFISILDSIDALDLLVQHGQAELPEDETFQALIEVGYHNARTGLRSEAEFHALVEAFDRHSTERAPVSLCGVQAYEGSITGTHAQRQARISEYLDFALGCYEQLATSGRLSTDNAPVFTAGGSSTFDLVLAHYKAFPFADRPPLWLRGGVAATYDHLVYRERLAEMDERGGFQLGGRTLSAVETFRPSLSIWAVVQSIPQTDLAILAAGMRDFPHDAGLPVALTQYRNGELLKEFTTSGSQLKVEKAMDHHAYVPISPDTDIRVGDVFRLGISHPCTAFDKWRFVYCVDDAYRVTRVVETFF